MLKESGINKIKANDENAQKQNTYFDRSSGDNKYSK